MMLDTTLKRIYTTRMRVLSEARTLSDVAIVFHVLSILVQEDQNSNVRLSLRQALKDQRYDLPAQMAWM